MKTLRPWPFLLLVGLALMGAAKPGLPASPTGGTSEQPPFQLPFAEPPGPDTWLLEQPYGNTTFAYRFRSSTYGAGQGLHFGIDLAARCGTRILAIGDGVVASVDNPAHGAAPHNLMIDHPNGYASFYGHLLATSPLHVGQKVRAGDFVGLTGDPDLTCTSRPHLHLEIRNAPSHTRAFNPLPLIRADWEAIARVGADPMAFEQDLQDPRRWQSLYSQPDVLFGKPLLNDYTSAWPPNW
jgi:murein DD-endopeptidase MepM/ murein hydrolase activator NlpD